MNQINIITIYTQNGIVRYLIHQMIIIVMLSMIILSGCSAPHLTIPKETSTPFSFPTQFPTHSPSFTETPTFLPTLTETTTFLPTLTETPTIIPTPELTIGSTRTSNIDGMVQVYIPAGNFIMGSEEWNLDEKPAHVVQLEAFWLDQHEVTNTQFAAFLNKKGIQVEEGNYWIDLISYDVHIERIGENWQPIEGYEEHPVEGVSWFGAQAYCEWVRRRLPTEAEWEKGARGGLEDNIYPWGNERAICKLDAENGVRFNDGILCVNLGTIPVMSYQPNGYGLYDMAGNVWDWVADWYDEEYYEISPSINPQGPEDGKYRVKRGGAENNIWNVIRVSKRSRSFPDITSPNIGFRCAASPP